MNYIVEVKQIQNKKAQIELYSSWYKSQPISKREVELLYARFGLKQPSEGRSEG